MAEAILADMRVGRGVTKLVLLKRMWPDLAADADLVALFVREARLGARMNHPNIAHTYEVLDDGNRPTIVMEYLDGQPLTRILDRLDSKSLGLTSRLRIITGLLAALEYAHELTDHAGVPNGLVHRDVNPHNVFVTYSGQVKLLDFGVAKSLAGAFQTRPGSVRGKLGYMAPEQVTGGVVDRRADLFAAGVMLWEMVAGRRLWEGMADGEIVRRLVERVPIPSLPGRLNLPRGLEAVCARAVSVRPQDRYASAAEFAAALERLLAASDDTHRRYLGRVVSLAFENERATRCAMIENYLKEDGETEESPARNEAHLSAPPLPSPASPAALMEEDHSSDVTVVVDEGAMGRMMADACAADGSVTNAPRVTARVRFKKPLPSWQWATVGVLGAGVVALVLSAVPRLTGRAVAKSGTMATRDMAVTAAPRAAAAEVPPAGIVIAPMRDGVLEPPPASSPPMSCRAGVAPHQQTQPADPPAPALAAAPAASPAQAAAVPLPMNAPAHRTKTVRLAERDGEEVTIVRTPGRPQNRERPDHDRATSMGDDDILQPSPDLTEVSPAAVSPVATALAETAPALATPAGPPAPARLARRTSRRPLDEEDPF